MTDFKESDLIYDWNAHERQAFKPDWTVEFDDETLRDGLQSPSVVDPDIDDKIKILHLMEQLGIQSVDIGLPAAGQRAFEDADRLMQEIVQSNLAIFPNCAARTLVADIEPIVELSQKHGVKIEAATFIGSSPIRQYAEGWDLSFILKNIETAIEFCLRHDLPVMFVTEDTTRAHPDHLRQLYTTAMRAGAQRICCADTVGHATPAGAAAIIGFLKDLVQEVNPEVKIDWHGHKDRGLDVANTLAAIEAGAHRVHGTALGIGERCGNTPMEQILINCKLLGWIDNDLTALNEYAQTVSRATNTPIPKNYPIVGEDAFRTATGVHAAAIIKAQKKGHEWLADRIYSSVPASWLNRKQKIEIGPMSGESNVVYWLQSHGFEPREEWVKAIFSAAKSSRHTLSEDEINMILQNLKH